MKQVLAVVKPHLAEAVIEALLKAPVEALTVREVRGYGRQKDYLNQYGETEYALAFLPKVEVEVWVDDSRLEEVVEVIEQTANTGRLGDGKIMVLPVKSFVTITDESPAAR
jgi:nitrogen regulatory protein PII